MGLFWLFGYNTELQLSGIMGLDEETVNTNIWLYTKAIQSMISVKVGQHAIELSDSANAIKTDCLAR